MDEIATIFLGISCFVTVTLVLLLAGGTYFIGVGAVQVPGIARRGPTEGKAWTTVAVLAHRAADAIGAGSGIVGSFLGLFGFLIPWASVRLTQPTGAMHPDGLNGSLSGVAFVLQLLLVGTRSLADGAFPLGIALLGLALLASMIALGLVLSAAVSLGAVSVPLGLTKSLDPRLLARTLLILGGLSIALSCAFFVATQAALTGLDLGGRRGAGQGGYELTLAVSNGFWVSAGGLVLSIGGALAMTSLGRRLSDWATRLAELDTGKHPE